MMELRFKKILYITYDGLTDALGQSQILPYLKGLSVYGYQFTVLSFEKDDLFKKDATLVRELTEESGIKWVPLSFTKNPPLLSKFYDALRMRRTASRLHKLEGFDMVHCRSYISADIGMQMKKTFGIKFFFDMRGLWADEKKEGGSWNMANPISKLAYLYYKHKEKQYLQNADFIISLTEAGKKELLTWPSYNKNIPLEVIPCCTDMDLFSLAVDGEKQQSRQELDLSMNDWVLSYLGSLGTCYMLDEMLLFFKQLKKQYGRAKFLFITQTSRTFIDKRVKELGLSPADFIVRIASRNEVPFFLKASDVNISFITPGYAKISSSPAKLGEVLSMGIPVISNAGVGDVKEIINAAGGGLVLEGFGEKDFSEAIEKIPLLLKISPLKIRDRIRDLCGLEKGISLYAESYRQVFNLPVTAPVSNMV